MLISVLNITTKRKKTNKQTNKQTTKAKRQKQNQKTKNNNHLNLNTSGFSGVHVVLSFVFCVMFCNSFFDTFSYGHIMFETCIYKLYNRYKTTTQI
jgi:hypothetical protein